MFNHALLMSAAQATETVFEDLDGVLFNGTDNVLLKTSDLTGNVNGKKGIISYWIKLQSQDDDLLYPFQNLNGTVATIRTTDNSMRMNLYGASSYAWDVTTSSDTFTSSSDWVHFMASWDLANTIGHVYVNGTSDQATIDTSPQDETIDYTKSRWGIGASSTPGNYCNADFCQFYVNLAEYIDLSDQSNRALFYNNGPVDLGSDGSTPTGNAPIIFQNIAAGADISGFITNKGSGGGFTLTGTLSRSSTRPEAS